MCIIIAKEAGKPALDEGYFERAWNRNSHGGGVVWKKPDDECAYIKKGFMNKEEFLTFLKEINKDENAFIAHFRIKSVGEVSVENTHPFVMDHVTFAHNGTLSLTPYEGKTDSETFGLKFLKKRSMKWIKENKELLEMALGTSKFAIMDNITGEIFILNPQNGKWQDEAWFSNSSADKIVELPSMYNYNNYRHYYDDLSDCCGRAPRRATSSIPEIYPDKTFGTKNFSKTFASYLKETKCFVYNCSKKPMTAFPYSDDLVVGKTGLLKLNECHDASKVQAESKEYNNESDEVKAVQSMQSDLNKLVDDYHKKTFDSSLEKMDAEWEIHALNCLLNAIRRLIVAKKVIKYESLKEFLLDNIAYSHYASDYQVSCADAFEDFLTIYIQDFLAIIGMDSTYDGLLEA